MHEQVVFMLPLYSRMKLDSCVSVCCLVSSPHPVLPVGWKRWCVHCWCPNRQWVAREWEQTVLGAAAHIDAVHSIDRVDAHADDSRADSTCDTTAECSLGRVGARWRCPSNHCLEESCQLLQYIVMLKKVSSVSSCWLFLLYCLCLCVLTVF